MDRRTDLLIDWLIDHYLSLSLLVLVVVVCPAAVWTSILFQRRQMMILCILPDSCMIYRRTCPHTAGEWQVQCVSVQVCIKETGFHCWVLLSISCELFPIWRLNNHTITLTLSLFLGLRSPLHHLSDQDVRHSPQMTQLSLGLVSIVTQELASLQNAALCSRGAMMWVMTWILRGRSHKMHSCY